MSGKIWKNYNQNSKNSLNHQSEINDLKQFIIYNQFSSKTESSDTIFLWNSTTNLDII